VPAVLVGLLLGAAAGAQDAASEDAGAAGIRRCRERADSLAAYRDRLVARADALGERQRAAALRGDRSTEGTLLARGEALADTIRAISAALLAQQLRCQQLGDPLPPPTDLPLPESAEGDPPTTLREKAGYARDLADRAERWLAMIARERERIVERRVAEEARRLVSDQDLLDERATLDLGGARAAILGEESALPGLLEILLREMPEAEGTDRPEVILDALEGWLATRRDSLVARAASLEVEADRREREP